MDRARELFDRIKVDGIKAIDALAHDAAAEELFLDFKTSPGTGPGGTLHHDDAENLSKAISGFGNAEGGVVIWGVDCRVDRKTRIPTVKKTPLSNAAAFRSQIEGAISRSSTPPHSQVQNVVVSDGTQQSGFVATLVPKAEFGPIRAIAGGTHRYYMRAGDSFALVPHDALAGLFGRKPRAVVFPLLTTTPVRQVPNGQVVAAFGLGLYNKGPVLAARPYVSVHPLAVFAQRRMTVQPRMGEQLAEFRRSDVGNVQMVAHGGVVIAPGGMVDLCWVSFQFPPIESEFRVEITLGTEASNFERFELFSPVAELEIAHATVASGQALDSLELVHAKDAIPALT